MRAIDDLAEIDRINAGFDTEADRIHALCDVYWHPGRDPATASLDPFSPAFRELVVERLARVTGRDHYDPTSSEKAPYLEQPGTTLLHPASYTTGDSTWLGEVVQAHGSVLKALAIKPGESILEYGPGDGEIALHLARLGCRVTVVDVEPIYLARIRQHAAALGVEITTREGLFGTAEPGRTYDRILFFEAFHHALDHQDLLNRLRNLLSPAGSIVLAGEPILGPDDYYRRTLPYAWGPRLDGLSLRAMRTYGWCELGYAREYLVELFMRAGFVLYHLPSPATDRGAAYIARPRSSVVDLAGNCLLEAWDNAGCWHPGEGTLRWSRTETAAIPLDGVTAWTQVTLRIAHLLGPAKPITVSSGETVHSYSFDAGEVKDVTFRRAEAGPRITIECAVVRPCDISPNADTRTLGCCVMSLTYVSD